MGGPWVWYGEERTAVPLPPGLEVREVHPDPVPAPAADPLAVVAAALDHPVGAPRLEDVARGSDRAVVVVPDATRPSGAEVYLLPLLARLARAGMVPRQIALVVGRGIHPVASRQEVVRLLGAPVMDALRVVQSAPDTPELNLPAGEDPEIGEIRVHRLVAEASLVILTGAVVPHHLAGFGGGPKAFVPGVAERETVLRAHRLTLRAGVRPDGSVASLAGRPEGNPFYEALLRAARAFGRTWLLNVVLAEGGGVAAAAAGEVGAAHAEVSAAWRRLWGETVPQPADLVVAGVAPPRDRDLVQAHKVLLAAAAWARPGAPIVWLARAAAGPGHPALLPWFEIPRLEDHLAALRRDFHPYGLTAYSLRRIAAEHPVHVVSEMPRDVLRPLGLLPAKDVKSAVEHALRDRTVATCAVLPSPPG